MADEVEVKDKVEISSALGLLFTDAAKNISDLKAREWQATTLAIAGIAGLISIARGSSNSPAVHSLTLKFMVLVVVAHALVMWRCHLNLGTFRERIKEMIKQKFPVGEKGLFKDQDTFADAVADEGTIEALALLSVWLAFAFGFFLLK